MCKQLHTLTSLTSTKCLVKVPQADEQAAKVVGSNKTYVSAAKKLRDEAPDLFEAVATKKTTIPEAKKEYQARQTKAKRAEVAEAGKAVPEDKRWSVYCADVNTYTADKQYDFIITDPPYPKEYLGLYEVLAKRAGEWLKPGGLLVAMCGQSYLEAIYELMSRHIDYYWTAAYLTPGQPTPLQRPQPGQETAHLRL